MKDILLPGGPLNRCTLCRAEREKEDDQRKASFVLSTSGDFPEFLIARLTPQMRARIRDCIVGALCRIVLSYGR